MENPNRWNTGKKILFRFTAVYFILYILTVFLSGLFDPLAQIAGGILHLPPNLIAAHPSGSGDTTHDYLLILCIAVLTPAFALVWTLIDYKRPNYNLPAYWVQVVVRYVLGYYMIEYGCAKLFLMQFQDTTFSTLLQSYGDSSPMGLLWRFMGYSYPFRVFTGIAEISGGVLLLFWRTKTIGSLLTITVMINVVAMNFCYDVPVKLFSAHLLLMALYILAPDLTRLYKFFIANKATATSAYPLTNKKWLLTRKIVKSIIVVVVLLLGLKMYAHMHTETKKTRLPLQGMYEIDSVFSDKNLVPLLITDTVTWRYFISEYSNYGIVKALSGKRTRYSMEVDTVNKTITLWAFGSGDMSRWRYHEPDSMHLILHGGYQNKVVKMCFTKKTAENFPLIKQGFHWISENPCNR